MFKCKCTYASDFKKARHDSRVFTALASGQQVDGQADRQTDMPKDQGLKGAARKLREAWRLLTEAADPVRLARPSTSAEADAADALAARRREEAFALLEDAAPYLREEEGRRERRFREGIPATPPRVGRPRTRAATTAAALEQDKNDLYRAGEPYRRRQAINDPRLGRDRAADRVNSYRRLERALRPIINARKIHGGAGQNYLDGPIFGASTDRNRPQDPRHLHVQIDQIRVYIHRLHLLQLKHIDAQCK